MALKDDVTPLLYPEHGISSLPPGRQNQPDATRREETLDVQHFIGRVNGLLAAAHGDGGQAAGGEPVGVEAAVADAGFRLETRRADGGQGGLHAGFLIGKLEGFVLQRGLEIHLAGFSGVVLDLFDGSLERLLKLVHDALAELGIVTASLRSHR